MIVENNKNKELVPVYTLGLGDGFLFNEDYYILITKPNDDGFCECFDVYNDIVCNFGQYYEVKYIPMKIVID